LAQSTGSNVTLSGEAAPAPSKTQTCVQVEIAGHKGQAYNCLNQELQLQVQATQSGEPQVPLNANSPDNAVGNFNRAGVAEQYGQNFGKSVIPYRPPPPVFNNAVH
jgi:hypothetical protein